MKKLPDREETDMFIEVKGFVQYSSTEDMLQLFGDFGIKRQDIARQYENPIERNHSYEQSIVKATKNWTLRVKSSNFEAVFDNRLNNCYFTACASLVKKQSDGAVEFEHNETMFGGSEDHCVVVSSTPRSHRGANSIRAFFSGFTIGKGCITSFGDETKASGQSVVRFKSKDEAERAILEKHLDYLGSRRVSVTAPGQAMTSPHFQNKFHQRPTNSSVL